ncbi:MAG: hypothetical protein NC907_00945 [Candidatus Omnitrophica bacterium]|nr:hypothetical protein [Candidatus Omnitrophota bacterium]
MCRKYPNARLILAHMGRGFNTYNVDKEFKQLTGIENIWFDTSIICESPTFISAVKRFGHRKILWGFRLSYLSKNWPLFHHR